MSVQHLQEPTKLKSLKEAISAMGRPHALVIPFPSQGHVTPLMELSRRLVDRGFIITFANAEGEHARIMAVVRRKGLEADDSLRLIAIPNFGPEVGWHGVWEDVHRVLPSSLELLIRQINEVEDDKINCVIVDMFMLSALAVAEKLGIKRAAFCFTSMTALAPTLHIPKMIDEGLIDANGIPTKDEEFRLSPTMPGMKLGHLYWCSIPDEVTRRLMYKMLLRNNELIGLADWILCNSFYDIEPSAMAFIPRALPIGPLLSQDRINHSQQVGHFWSEDSTCLDWLDHQPAGSVVYAAFGSLVGFTQHQVHEFALGLELMDRPFLWTVRPGLMDGSAATFPDGFQERVAKRGKLITWAPQQKVLAHPSIACFITHCGWNSSTEGLGNGVPFLCWPRISDQFLHQSFICDVWKVGMAFDQDNDGVVTKEEVKRKVDGIICNGVVKARALELKKMVEKAISKEGASYKNFEDFVGALM